MRRCVTVVALAAGMLACRDVAVPVEVVEGRMAMDDGVELYYRSVGAGEPVLVVPMAVYLADALGPLARGRRVVFYDPRNRGRSERAPLESVSAARQILDLDQLRQGLGLDSMALLGWSGLGMEMAAYAIRYPQRVTRLVQVGAVPPAAALMTELGGDTRASRTDQDAVDSLATRWEEGRFAGTEADFCRRYSELTLPASFADPAHMARVPDLCAHENEWPVNLWPYFGALLGSMAGYDLRPDLAGLRIPRLVIHGREDGIPVEGGRAWAAGYDSARFVELSPSGHFPFLEQPETFFRLVNAFLDGRWPGEARPVMPRE